MLHIFALIAEFSMGQSSGDRNGQFNTCTELLANQLSKGRCLLKLVCFVDSIIKFYHCCSSIFILFMRHSHVSNTMCLHIPPNHERSSTIVYSSDDTLWQIYLPLPLSNVILFQRDEHNKIFSTMMIHI